MQDEEAMVLIRSRSRHSLPGAGNISNMHSMKSPGSQGEVPCTVHKTFPRVSWGHLGRRSTEKELEDSKGTPTGAAALSDLDDESARLSALCAVLGLQCVLCF